MTTIAIMVDRESTAPIREEADPPFNLDDLNSTGSLARIIGRLLDDPQWLFGLLRVFRPIVRLPFTNWWIISRYDDVQEVLTRHEVFEVPFGPKTMELNGGPNFLLGMPAGAEYSRYQSQVLQAFRLEDSSTIVAPKAFEFADEIISNAQGRLDAVQDLITRVPILLCEHYYGIPVGSADDRLAFGHWTIAMSTFLFGDPTDRPEYRRAAVAAGIRVRRIIDCAIAAAKARRTPHDTVVARLVRMQRDGAEGLSDEVIRAFLIGMITGFVPTVTMAAGHILEMLMRRPDFMAHARAAACAGDDSRLQRCLFEAMRFKPLNPGPYRRCAADYTLAAGTPRARMVSRGDRLLVGTQSAMFDSRRVHRPRDFNPDRPPGDYMLFGFGLHWCTGTFIAQPQITQTLKALLLRNGLRRAAGPAGQLQRIGPFPGHLVVEFDR
jgi:cytochrome P450